MGCLKVETINLTPQLATNGAFTVKLDAWRCTFYYFTRNANNRDLLLDSLDLSLFSHDHDPNLTGNHGNGPLTIVLGGAFYKGVPIMLDDQISFRSQGTGSSETAFLLIKENFILDRPGPDALFNEPPPAPIAPRTVRPRITTPAPVASSVPGRVTPSRFRR